MNQKIKQDQTKYYLDMNKLTTRCYSAVAKELFGICPECEGQSRSFPIAICIRCKGSGINQTTEMSKVLMRVVELIGATNLSFRCQKMEIGSFYIKRNLNSYLSYKKCRKKKDKIEAKQIFQREIENKPGDCLAQIQIYLLAMCKWLGLEPCPVDYNIYTGFGTITDQLLFISKCVHRYDDDYTARWLGEFLKALGSFCKQNRIDIDKHIEARLRYLGVKG